MFWWTHLDLNQGPLACEASALTGLSYASTEPSIIAPALEWPQGWLKLQTVPSVKVLGK
jgi:hypothetical protein